MHLLPQVPLYVIIVLFAMFMPCRGYSATDATSLGRALVSADSMSNRLKYDSALAILQQAVNEYRSSDVGTDTLLARALQRLGEGYKIADKIDSAVAQANKAFEIRKDVFGPDHTEVASSLLQLGVLSIEKGNFYRAETLLVRALTIRETSQGRDHPDLVPILLGLARRYLYSGKHEDGVTSCQRALGISRVTMGEKSVEVARSLNGLGVCHLKQGGPRKAKPFFEQALCIMEEKLGRSHPDVAIVLNNLANLASGEMQLVDAVALHRRALSIRQSVLGPTHSLVSQTIGNLADVYYNLHQFDKARQLSDSMFNLDTLAGPNNTYAMAYCLMQAAQCGLALGKIDEAYALLTRAEPLFLQTVGERGPRYLYCLSVLSQVASTRHNWSEVERLCARLLSLSESVFPAYNPTVVYARCKLAYAYMRLGRLAKADTIVRSTYLACDSTLGHDSPTTAGALEELARCLMFQGKRDTAAKLANDVAWTRHRNLIEVASGLTESEAFTYSEEARQSVDLYLGYLSPFTSLDSQTVHQTAQLILNTKGQVSDGLLRRRRLLLLNQDSTTIPLADSVNTAKRRLSRLFASGGVQDLRSRCDSLRRNISDLESRLYERSALSGILSGAKPVDLAEIASLLAPSSKFIEYVKYELSSIEDDSVQSHYLALVLGADAPPSVVELGPSSTIDSLVTRYHEHMEKQSTAKHLPSRQDRDDYEQIGKALFVKAVKPCILGPLDSIQNLIIAADGGLNLVSFGCLIDPDGQFLIERFPVTYLSAGRDLMPSRDEYASGHGVLAMGDPDFDAAITDINPASAGAVAALTVEDRFVLRGPPSNCEILRNCSVPRLAGSRLEIAAIRQTLRDGLTDSICAYLGASASEEVFKAQASGKRILHLATHGYFLEGSCDPSSGSHASGFGPSNWIDNPLLLSGLFLAGCNHHQRDTLGPAVEDGILSAYEISTMDLRGVGLVTLSACESGLGDVRNGEGVYGLRRAFQIAGATGVVSSLWRVPDQIVGEMMSQLYSSSSQLIPDRLRELQLAQIRKLRASGFADHPYSWAPFVAQGDWRNPWTVRR